MKRRRGAKGQRKCTKEGGEGKGRHVGSCQNYGPFLGTLNNRCRIIIGTQKGTIIFTTTPCVSQGVGQGRTSFARLMVFRSSWA